jgi:hypothetical protein
MAVAADPSGIFSNLVLWLVVPGKYNILVLLFQETAPLKPLKPIA